MTKQEKDSVPVETCTCNAITNRDCPEHDKPNGVWLYKIRGCLQVMTDEDIAEQDGDTLYIKKSIFDKVVKGRSDHWNLYLEENTKLERLQEDYDALEKESIPVEKVLELIENYRYLARDLNKKTEDISDLEATYIAIINQLQALINDAKGEE